MRVHFGGGIHLPFPTGFRYKTCIPSIQMNRRVQARGGSQEGGHRPASLEFAFTLLELLAAIAIITIIASLLLPSLSKAKVRSQRAACSNHLRVIGVALNGFANDHEDRYPMALLPGLDREPVPGLIGSRPGMEFVLSPRPFQALSNDLTTPKVFLCPTERRTPALSFANLQPSQISYALGLGARPGDVQSPVATDRNLTNVPVRPAPGPGGVDEVRLSWTAAMHTRAGHVLLGDGHVEYWKNFRVPPDPGRPAQAVGTANASLPRQAGPAQPGRPGGSEPSQAGARYDSSGGAERRNSRVPSLVAEDPQAVPPGVPREKQVSIGTNSVSPMAAEIPAVGEPADDASITPVVSVFKWAYLLCLLWALLVLLAYYLRHRERVRRRRMVV